MINRKERLERIRIRKEIKKWLNEDENNLEELMNMIEEIKRKKTGEELTAEEIQILKEHEKWDRIAAINY